LLFLRCCLCLYVQLAKDFPRIVAIDFLNLLVKPFAHITLNPLFSIILARNCSSVAFVEITLMEINVGRDRFGPRRFYRQWKGTGKELATAQLQE